MRDLGRICRYTLEIFSRCLRLKTKFLLSALHMGLWGSHGAVIRPVVILLEGREFLLYHNRCQGLHPADYLLLI